jgi:glutathione S-transferase
MKLHWSPRSPFVRKVMVVAHDIGVAGRIERVRTVAAMMKPHPDLMLDNPLSKIPTLVLDNGKVLYDSAVICEYLDHLHDGPNSRRWLVELDVVAALVGKHVLAMR